MLPAAGRASALFGMPADPAFVGVVLRNQMLEIELGPSFQIASINSSNGLALTIGAF